MNSMSHDSTSEHEASTADLVARLRGRDPLGAEMLDRLYRDALVRFCWGYLGRMDQAEDAVQEVCFKVLSAADTPEHFRPWLYKIARNHCINILRERAANHREARLPSGSLMPDSLTGHLTRLVKEEMRSKVSELVARLTEVQREVLRLRYVEELPRAEIALVLDLPESVVKSRLFEGLKRLREYAELLEEQ
jgi:RNA polymerase sigma-70 factor (ECF subfamily)